MESDSENYFTFQDVVELSPEDCHSALTRLVETYEAEVFAQNVFREVSCSQFMLDVNVDDELETIAYEIHSHAEALLVTVKIFAGNPAGLAKGFSLLWPPDVGPSWFLAA